MEQPGKKKKKKVDSETLQSSDNFVFSVWTQGWIVMSLQVWVQDWGKREGGSENREKKSGDEREKPRWCKQSEREGQSKRNWYVSVLLTSDIEIKIFPVQKVSSGFMRMRLHFFRKRSDTWLLLIIKTAAEGPYRAQMMHLCCLTKWGTNKVVGSDTHTHTHTHISNIVWQCLRVTGQRSQDLQVTWAPCKLLVWPVHPQNHETLSTDRDSTNWSTSSKTVWEKKS